MFSLGVVPNVYELRPKQPTAQFKVTLLFESFLGSSENIDTSESTVKIYNESTGDETTSTMLIDDDYDSTTKQWEIVYGGGTHNNKYKIEVHVETNATPPQKEEVTIFFEVFDL